MKVIFLDLDGVLVLKKDEEAETFDHDCCMRLREILTQTQCKLVLSSTWRLFPPDVHRMFCMLKPYQITLQDFLGKTPLRDRREEEIEAFLKKHPEIEQYIVLDDSKAEFGEKFSDHLVLTQATTGITQQIMQMCVEKLNRIK